MDVETSEAIESLRRETGQGEQRLTAQIVRSETSTKAELREEMRQLEARLSAQIARSEISTKAELREEMRQLEGRLRGEMVEIRTQNRMLNERQRDDIRLVAEAVAVLSVKVDGLIAR